MSLYQYRYLSEMLHLCYYPEIITELILNPFAPVRSTTTTTKSYTVLIELVGLTDGTLLTIWLMRIFESILFDADAQEW
ncbi:MAG: hypothetical protein WBL44_16310 [Nitrososphaeraceae archaeon]